MKNGLASFMLRKKAIYNIILNTSGAAEHELCLFWNLVFRLQIAKYLGFFHISTREIDTFRINLNEGQTNFGTSFINLRQQAAHIQYIGAGSIGIPQHRKIRLNAYIAYLFMYSCIVFQRRCCVQFFFLFASNIFCALFFCRLIE